MKKNKSKFRRILSLFLAIVISITMQDMTVFAASATGTNTNTSNITEESSLNERLTALDAAINTALHQRQKRLSVEKYHVTRDEFNAMYFNISHLYPIYPYVAEKLGYIVNNDGILSTIVIMYKEDETQLREMNEAAKEIVDIINNSPRELEDYEKAWIVYEWLARNCTYYPGYNPGDDTSEIPDEYFTAYNALVKKEAVCTGYASGYAYIMKELLGIPCETVSYPAGDHAWNMIQIDRNWYHVDPTWGSYGSGAVNGEYFMLTDKELISKDPVHHCSSAKVFKSYKIESATGPSFVDKNALWFQLDAFSFNGNTINDIAFFEGYYYYSYLTYLCRTDSLLNFDEQNFSDGQQIIGKTDGSSSSIYDIVMPRPMDICVYNDCLYYHGIQRIFRLNPAEVNEEDRVFVPGKTLDIGEDITYNVIDASHPAYNTLSLNDSTAKRESTTFISGFHVKDNHITFNITKSGKTEHICDFEYLSQNISRFNDESNYFYVRGDFAVGTQLTAVAAIPSSIKPTPYETATAYYRWYRDDFQICKNTSGLYTPTMDDIGKTLRVEVTFDNFAGKLSKEIGILPKMVPTLPAEAPKAVTGERSTKLEDITPPAGYVWKEPDTVLTEVGEHNYPALYSPDSSKYEYIDASLKVIITECKHTWDEGRTTKKASCTEAGEKTFTCSKCNDTKIEPITPVGHLWDNGSTTKKATCAQTGTKTYHCYRCTETKTEKIAKTSYHSYKTGKITKTPTATKKGVYTWDCSLCSSKKAVTLLCAKTGNFTSGTTYIRVHSSAKSTNSNIIGSLRKNAAIIIFEENTNPEWTKICYDDGVAFIMTKYVVKTTNASGLQDTDKTSEAPKIGSQSTVKKMTYKVTSANTVEFTKTTINSGTVTIPASVKINGKTCKVTSIAAKALKNNKKIKKVVIGSNVVTIKPDAFRGCKNLKTITIKSFKLKTVGKNALKGIHKKAKISCPKNKKKTYKKYFKSSTGYKKTMKIK